MKRRLVGLTISLVILGVLWARVDTASIWRAAVQVDQRWFAAAILMTVPLTLGTSERFRLLTDRRVGHGTAIRLILSASSLNLVLPSKMGDIAKAWVLRRYDGIGDGRALSLVVLEKLFDMLSLLAMGALAATLLRTSLPGGWIVPAATAGGAALLLVLILPGISVPTRYLTPRLAVMIDNWRALTAWLWTPWGRGGGMLAGSLALWFGHLLQLWFFARAIVPDVPFGFSVICATLAILAGLLPFTFAGVGTRDAAMVVLFAPWLNGPQAALLGLFATLRYILPAIAGLPFLGDYWAIRSRTAR